MDKEGNMVDSKWDQMVDEGDFPDEVKEKMKACPGKGKI